MCIPHIDIAGVVPDAAEAGLVLAVRTISAKFHSKCHECGRPIAPKDEAIYDDDSKWIWHPECAPDSDNSKVGPFSAATDGYRRPERTPDQLADDLGFDKNGDLK